MRGGGGDVRSARGGAGARARAGSGLSRRGMSTSADITASALASFDRCADERQEFVLWSDALGLSMLIDALAKPPGATESTVLGPFYATGSPEREYGQSMAAEPAGVPAWVHGRVLDVDGAPIAGAVLDVWQNGADRLYAVRRPE